jgi:hypothetical protein
MRKLTTALFAGAAAIAITVTAGGSAYAGETGTTRLVSPGVLVWHSGTDFQDDLNTGCRSHREDLRDQTRSIEP